MEVVLLARATIECGVRECDASGILDGNQSPTLEVLNLGKLLGELAHLLKLRKAEPFRKYEKLEFLVQLAALSK